MPQARTVFQPDSPIEVSDEEYEVLKVGGLLADAPAPTDTKTTGAAAQPPATPSTTTGAPAPAADTTIKKG